MPPRSISDEFNDSYAEKGLQPSTGRRDVIKHARVEYAQGVATSSMRAGGAPMQQGGRIMTVAGKGVTKAGMVMSRTGAGAVVGVPLMAIGGAAKAAGGAATQAGQATEKTSRSIQKIQRGVPISSLKKAPDLLNDLKSTAKATRTSVMIFSWAIPLWFSFQLPLAILTLIAFGAADTAASLLPAWLVEWAAGDILMLLQVSVFFIGVGTLIAMAIMYALSGVRCFFGEGAHVKGPVFCLAVVGYVLPFVNAFPWFLLWALAVWRYPK